MRGFLLCLGALLAATLPARPAVADGASMRALALPTRRDADALHQQLAEVTAALARRLGAELIADAADPKLEAAVSRGRELAARGALDAAASELDQALELGASSPHRVGDPAGFVTAHVARVAIALARGEDREAEDLLERVVEYDPGFALTPAETSPRVESALGEARRRLGRRPTLRVSSVGEACRDGATILVVARGLPDGSSELLRFDRCRLVARVTTTARTAPDEIAAALDPMSTPPATDTPLYRRPWFWAGAAAVVAAGSAALYLGLRDDPDLQVVPHF